MWLRRVSHNFADQSTIHGISRFGNSSRSKARRIIWFFVFATAFGMCTFQIVQLFLTMLNTPFSTSVKLEHLTSRFFPAVTVCNLNPLNLDKVILYNNTGSSFLQAVCQRILELTRQPNANFSYRGPSDIPNNEDPTFAINQEVLYWMNSLNNSDFLAITYNISEFLGACSFSGIKCGIKDFIFFKNPYYGTCYTFNMQPDPTTWKRVTASGSDAGLSLTLFLDQDSYLPVVVPDVGYKIVIHEQEWAPEPHREGVLARPGLALSLSLKANEYHRQAPPNGDCHVYTRAHNLRQNHLASQLPTVNLNPALCMATCKQQSILQTCGCYSFWISYVDGDAFKSIDPNSRGKVCNVTRGSPDGKCVDEVLKQVGNGEHGCKSRCNFQICKHTVYSAFGSSAEWPALKTVNNVIADVMNSTLADSASDLETMTSPTARYDYLKQNYLKVNVFFEDLNLMITSTTRVYTPLTFLADVGGIGGLWLGCSLLSFIELIEFLIDVSYNAIRKCKYRKKIDGEMSTNEMPSNWMEKKKPNVFLTPVSS